MKGTIVNAAAVLMGSGIGFVLKKGLPERYQQTLMTGIGICVGVIGVQMALKTNNILIVIMSILLGGLIGETIDIDKILERVGQIIANQLGNNAGRVAEGFITASLVYCIGAMAVVGAIQDGLTGDATTLYAKSMLDGISSVVFTATFGIGVAFSAVSILIYQGGITLLAGIFSSFITEKILTEITATGGVLIIGIGILMLGMSKIKIANLLPAIIVAGFLAAMID